MPVPTITSLGPSQIAVGSDAFTLTINGTDFDADAVVDWNGSPRATTFISATQLEAQILAADVAAVGTANVTVRNPTSAGGTPFSSVIQWPHLDFGNLGVDKSMTAIDLVIRGTCTLSVGYDQRFQEFDVSGPWTAPYEIDGDTLVGMPIPFDLTAPSFALRLEFASEQSWEWLAAQIYIQDRRP